MSTGGLAIRVAGLGKLYRLGTRESYKTLRDTLAQLVRPSERGAAGKPELRALRDVSFEVRPGEVVGLIGRNGAGKSTLLKILSRITEPTEGRALVNGRLGALLEVGTGFHPELTGRENLFLAGAILGMRRAEVTACFDEVVAFAELDRFIDTPVKRYSSGMYMRLAFSIAAHLRPDILLVDEVLAVGDAAFQRKSLGKMGEVGKEGRTVLFVSHNLAAIANLCPRSLLLDGGRLLADGQSADVLGRYLASTEAAQTLGIADRKDRQGTQRLRFLDLNITDERGCPLEQVMTGQAVGFRLRYESSDGADLRNVHASIAVTGLHEQRLFYLSTLASQPFTALPARGLLVCRVPRLPLLPGRYQLSVLAAVGDQLADWVQSAAPLDVAPGDFFGTGRLPPDRGGHVVVDHQWVADQDTA